MDETFGELLWVSERCEASRGTWTSCAVLEADYETGPLQAGCGRRWGDALRSIGAAPERLRGVRGWRGVRLVRAVPDAVPLAYPFREVGCSLSPELADRRLREVTDAAMKRVDEIRAELAV